ncbi:MAG: hemerythrin domain-containing protein [Ignavibacteriales bacterium]|nr:hemerythrin domain-containing protein [Ignavibacteriales bacterium]
MNTPLKRHAALVQLSREHHDGLLLAVRLQQGKNALLRLWSHDVFWQAEYIVKFFDEHLTNHFAEEERFLFPLGRKYITEPHTIVDQLEREHQHMRLYVDLFRNPKEKNLVENLKQFGKLLEQHIRCEEREFFPLLEIHLPEQTWKELEQQLQQRHSTQKS